MTLSARQLQFFRALLAPFPAECYGVIPRGGKSLTYLKPRAIMNRLDEVCGPLGWTPEYTATPGGQKCRLKILCPDHTEDGWAWHCKDDGAGTEDMGKNTADGWERNEDDSEKSAYTNAFRRACGVWGFGRELYQEGVPNWIADLHVNAPARSQAPRTTGGSAPPTGQRGQDFSPPTQPPKAMFAWIKKMEERYQADGRLLGAATAIAKANNWPTRTDQLDQAQSAQLGQKLVAVIKTWDEYDGIFDNGQPSPQAAPPQPSGGDLEAIKRAIMAAATTWVQKQLGRAPELKEIVSAVGELGASVVSGNGYKGEVLTSLRDCTDKTWLVNILAECQRQIQRAAYQATEVGGQTPGVVQSEIPF
jgi:Rad52/22 family double-strand break repair protein